MASRAWHDALELVTSLQRRKAADGATLWYRGQCCVPWRLRSSLHRYILDQLASLKPDPPPTPAELRDLLFEQGKTLFHKFRAKAWPLLAGRERSPWGIVFSMQHHGVPTRLIDWTESLPCALYFAQRERAKDGTAALFILDPEALNKKSLGAEGLVAMPDDFEEKTTADIRPYHPRWKTGVEAPLPTVAVGPFLSNSRMIAQRAAFTLAGDSFDPIEDQYPGILWKIELPPETYDDIEEFLRLASVGPFTYFPDLDGLAREIMGRR